MMTAMLDRPLLDKSRAPGQGQIAGVPLHDLALPWRLVWRIAMQQPRAFRHFRQTLYRCVRDNPRALGYAGMLATLFLHFGPFSRFIIAKLDRQIAGIDADEWRPPGILQVRLVAAGGDLKTESERSPSTAAELPSMARVSGRDDP